MPDFDLVCHLPHPFGGVFHPLSASTVPRNAD